MRDRSGGIKSSVAVLNAVSRFKIAAPGIVAITVFVFALATQCSNVAHAYLPNRWYVAGEGAYFLGNIKYEAETTTKIQPTYDDYTITVNGGTKTLKADVRKLNDNPAYTGAGGLVAAGYHLYDNFRLELAAAFYHASARYKSDALTLKYPFFNQKGDEYRETFNFGGMEGVDGYKGRYINGQVLGRIFFDFINPTPFTPFIGLGVGAGYHMNKIISANGQNFAAQYGVLTSTEVKVQSANKLQYSGTYFAATFNLGASYNFNPETSMYLIYTIMRRPDDAIQTYINLPPPSKLALNTVFRNYSNMSQSIALGIRYVFN